MTDQFIDTTQGICPVCHAIVNAKVVVRDNRVLLEKNCLTHGRQTALISSDYEYYRRSHEYIRPGQMQAVYFGQTQKGCPHDCGLCPEHEQHICMPVIEINGACNLDCPICIADEKRRPDLTLEEIRQMVANLLKSEGRLDVLNISGGEPTLHPRYREIMAYLCSVEEITTVSVSTNGLALLEDSSLLNFHQTHDIVISLQLDGCRPEVYKALRGRDLLAPKRQIVKRLVENGNRFSLIATLAKGVNDTVPDIAYLLDLLLTTPNLLSLLIQPLVYKKRWADTVNVMDRLTIPDVIRLVEAASNHRVAADDFMPLPCCHANCFALVHLLQYDDNAFIPFKRLLNQERYIDTIKNRSFFGGDGESFEEIRETIFDIWTGAANLCDCMRETTEKALQSIKTVIKEVQRESREAGGHSPRITFKAAGKRIKSLYIHHFMDQDTFDLTRARRCCTVYPKPDGKFYPLCVYNNLYRGRTTE